MFASAPRVSHLSNHRRRSSRRVLAHHQAIRARAGGPRAAPFGKDVISIVNGWKTLVVVKTRRDGKEVCAATRT
jgi:hypothetical protein